MTALLPPRALLLDLDGTLIDSVPDIARALAAILTAHGLPPLDEAAVRQRIGHGVARLVESGFAAVGHPLAGPDLAAATAAMMDAYRARLTDRTRLIGGVEVLVAACEARTIRLACVTNKPEAMARTILDHFGLSAAIPIVIGGDGPLPRKPAPDPLLAALARLGVAPDEAWMVGDGHPDMQAARAAGVVAVAVRSDYGEPLTPDLYDWLADDPAGVAALIEATPPPLDYPNPAQITFRPSGGGGPSASSPKLWGKKQRGPATPCRDAMCWKGWRPPERR